MTSTDTKALIEEAREIYAAHSPAQYPMDCPACAVRRLADALEAEMTARRDLVDKIESRSRRANVPQRNTPAHPFQMGVVMASKDCVEALRGLVSGDKKEQRNG